jgi:ribosome hibernation promoting factor
MPISITGRHVDITPAMREYLEERLDRLQRAFEPLDIQVTLSVEKYRHRAEMQMRDNSGSFFAAEETDDIYTSIDQVVDRLENQVRKLRDKIIESHHGRRAQNAKQSFLSTEAQESDNRFGPY